MRILLLLFCVLLGNSIYSQRVIIPDQELLYPFLNDPSYIGEGQRVQLTGLLQLADSDFQHTTKWLNAQVSLYDNVAFGLDYFNDSFDFYDYSTVMFTTAVKVGLGEQNHYLKIALSAGGESRKQDSRPLSMIPPGQNYVADVTNNNIEFIYKAGLHYTNKNITLGGYFNSLPVQDITFDDITQDRLLHYKIEEGITAYALYNWRAADKIRITPMVRYLGYLEDALIEGAVKANYADKVEFSLAYRNDYSINPAFRVRVVKALDLGYSYEKAMGSTDFEDVHGISASYKFFMADDEEPEWLRNVKDNIEEVAEIKENKKEEKKAERQKKKEEARALKAAEKAERKRAETVIAVEEVVEEEQTIVREEAVVPVKQEAAPEEDEVKEADVAEQQEPVNEAPEVNQDSGILAKGFYIVVGSFDSQVQAEAFMNSLDKSIYFPRKGRKEAGGPLHVYIDSDNNRDEANKRFRAHKLDRNFKNVVLLEVQ
ncbi:MAG: type IX secretion system membrane protein PorP/SprF [Eudoraea sp.]|nr:type IX secretion system membrane protein PorP/SprF [Eudoraea sp.]